MNNKLSQRRHSKVPGCVYRQRDKSNLVSINPFKLADEQKYLSNHIIEVFSSTEAILPLIDCFLSVLYSKTQEVNICLLYQPLRWHVGSLSCYYSDISLNPRDSAVINQHICNTNQLYNLVLQSLQISDISISIDNSYIFDADNKLK